MGFPLVAGPGFVISQTDSPVSPAESSLVNLRTNRSPPVALHLASRRRSYDQLQAGVGVPEEDLHLSGQTRLQAHWDLATGQEMLTLRGIPAGSLAWRSAPTDAARLRRWDQTVKLWDAGLERKPSHSGGIPEVSGAWRSAPTVAARLRQLGRTVKVWDPARVRRCSPSRGILARSIAWPGQKAAASPPPAWRSAPTATVASASEDTTVKVWDAREVTPELLVRDEARGLILYLIDRVATEADLRDRVAGDRTRSPAVRAAALDMVSSFWRERVRRRAEAIVGPLFARIFLRDDVLAALQAQPPADLEIQQACLKLAGTWPESAGGATRQLGPGSRPRAAGSDYERGLRLARTACRLEPDSGFFLNTLGVAQYRAGLAAEALATLTRSNALNKEKEPADLAFLAMAHQRLGHSAKARHARPASRRDRQAGPNISQSTENRAFLAEAEAVVLYDPIFPADPFAP